VAALFRRLFLAIIKLFRCPIRPELTESVTTPEGQPKSEESGATDKTTTLRPSPSPPTSKSPQRLKPDINLNIELLKTAQSYVGTMEKGGDNKGPEVEAFQKAVDGKAHGEAWCMSYVQFCIKEVEQKFGIDSTIFKSEHCLTVWGKSPGAIRVARPTPGCIVIWRFKGTFNGHVGIVEKVGANNYIETIEGNTGESVGGIQDSDGVYRRVRRMDPPEAVKMQVLGYIRAFQ